MRADDLHDPYLELMKRLLVRDRFAFAGDLVDVQLTGWKRRLSAPVRRALATRGIRLVAPRSKPGETMIHRAGLDVVQDAVETVIADEVPGDLIECGVWRGGTTIFMRALLAVHGNTDRTVWVADSFAGVPPPDERFPTDEGYAFHEHRALAVTLDEVRANFALYDLLDDQVRFLVGWFSETLAVAPIEQLAVLRLDGDLYQSTWEALEALEPKLSPGGFVIIDDYGTPTREAVDDYRAKLDIHAPLVEIDGQGVLWRK